MKKANGYITELKNKKTNRFRLRLQINGERKYYYFNSREDAEKYRSQILVDSPKIYKKGKVQYFSIRTLFNEYLEFKKLSLAESTILNRGGEFRNFFNGFLDKWLHLLTKDDVVKIVKKEMSVSSRKCHTAIFTLCELNEYSLEKYGYGLTWSPVPLKKQIKIQKGMRKKPREYHTKEEMVLIASHLKKLSISKKKKSNFFLFLYHVYRAGVSIGARGGEICSLKKKNFNKRDKTLLINSTIANGLNGAIDSKVTKTKESRVVQLSNVAIDSIEWLIQNSSNEYVLGCPKGSRFNFYTTGCLSDYFKRYLRDVDVPWIGTHGLFRKTFATQIALNSKKGHRDMIASIQNQLGHKSPQMTLHYIQEVDTSLDDELSLFDDLA
ncbi:tyrosine-type recombinase/integrase [Halobacteriovorax sp. RZ-3]|uniref:tyrosine-type recombinase/integrase n=1 Tax=Halobacteriovorax sp. RZ-3 TaxID=3157720 RepID=UPI00370F93BC